MPLGQVSFLGVASGLDIRSIISAILEAERQPVRLLEGRQQGIDARRTALQDFSGKLSALRTTLQGLSTTNDLSARVATSADTSIVTATASASADLGLHEVEVQSLARSHRVRSVAFNDRFEPSVTDGTITIKAGANDLITVNVAAASGNNSLSAIAQEINAADSGVTATIVNDGTGDLLVVRSTDTGAANALTISDSTNLDLDEAANELESAADATVIVDGITVTSATNTLTRAISGVTLDLVSANTGTKVTVAVEADTDAVKDKIRKFVDEYNVVADFFKAQFAADPESGRAGTLAADGLLRRVQGTLQSLVSGGVPGLPSTGLTSLGAVGISIEGATGRLEIDEAKLEEALTDSFDEVVRLFAVTGQATENAVSFVGVTSATVAGTYSVEVTTAPEKATVSGSTVINAGGITADETLTFTLSGTDYTVDLLTGDTITDVVGKINTALSAAGVGVRASDDAGKLKLSTIAYGTAADFSVVSDRADLADGNSTGIGTTVRNDTGVDIAGLIDGQAATGNGTVLTGADGTDVEGLQVSVVTDPATVTAKSGDFGTITVTRGVANALARELKSVVEPTGGIISLTVEGLNDETRRIEDQISLIEERLLKRELFLTLQFEAAERAIQALQQQQSALGQAF